MLSYYYDDLDYYASEDLNYLTSSEPIYNHYYMNGIKRTYINTDSIKRGGFLFAYEVNLLQNQLELSGKAKTGSIKHDLLSTTLICTCLAGVQVMALLQADLARMQYFRLSTLC